MKFVKPTFEKTTNIVKNPELKDRFGDVVFCASMVVEFIAKVTECDGTVYQYITEAHTLEGEAECYKIVSGIFKIMHADGLVRPHLDREGFTSLGDTLLGESLKYQNEKARSLFESFSKK